MIQLGFYQKRERVNNMRFIAEHEFADYDILHKINRKEFISPFTHGGTEPSSYCFVTYKGLFGKWKIRQSIVMAVKYTNCWLLCMDNGWEYFAEDIGKEVFEPDQLQEAIELCDKRNRLRKIKVKNL